MGAWLYRSKEIRGEEEMKEEEPGARALANTFLSA